MSVDLKDFFLAMPMDSDEYMKVPYKHFPLDIRARYKLDTKVTESNNIVIKMKKGMYGIKKAAILAYDQLKKYLTMHRYCPIVGTTGMWEHKTRQTKFCVCVNDFGIKYFNKGEAEHLFGCLWQKYKCTTDMQGKNYCGLTFGWHYDKDYVNVAMP